jgi:sentrin-specific protease 7
MFVYKTGKTSISVTWDDYYRLEEGKFLNDTCIEFYIRWMYDQWDEEKQKSCYIFNTFFYQNLSSRPKGAWDKNGGYTLKFIERETQIINYDMIQRWTKNDEVFSSKFVFVPINEKLVLDELTG